LRDVIRPHECSKQVEVIGIMQQGCLFGISIGDDLHLNSEYRWSGYFYGRVKLSRNVTSKMRVTLTLNKERKSFSLRNS
jgi:hypothetical protein